jgi:hypothetical protein
MGDVLYTGRSPVTRIGLSLFLYAAAFSPAVPSSAVQRIEGPNRRRRSEDLYGCRRIRFLGNALARPLVSFLFIDDFFAASARDPL